MQASIFQGFRRFERLRLEIVERVKNGAVKNFQRAKRRFARLARRSQSSQNAGFKTFAAETRRRSAFKPKRDAAPSSRFSRVPSRPPLLLIPRLEATCGTKFRGSSRRSPAVRRFRRRVASSLVDALYKRPCRVFQRFSTSSNDDASDENGVSAVGPSARRIGRSLDGTRTIVEPKAVWNKGIFRIAPESTAANGFSRTTRNRSASRDNRGDVLARRARSQPIRRPPNFVATTSDAKRKPRVERRPKRKSRSRSAAARPDAGFDNKVPPRNQRAQNRNILPYFSKQRVLPRRVNSRSLRKIATSPALRDAAKQRVFPSLPVLTPNAARAKVFAKISPSPFSKKKKRV